MKRIYYHYSKWEDYKNGLYRTVCVDEENLTKKCVDLLKSKDLKTYMNLVIRNWIYSSEVNMTNTGMNRQAWLGQSACCLRYGAPDFVTKKAWNLLTESQQRKANDIADVVIYEWDKKYA